jgi:isopenicillin-N epimerase
VDALRSLFLLDPAITYLNHGSFGACPKEVFEIYQSWQRKLERNPSQFLGRQVTGLLEEARNALGQYLGVQADEVVYFPNPTTALNMVVRNLTLEPGDEILATNHEYGAMDRTWQYFAERSGARYINWPISTPVSDPEQFVQMFWEGVTPRTRVIFISHITSPTALIFPIQEICRRASTTGILTIIDGAHAPGQIPLDLRSIGATIYAGALHKWLSAPKGAAFVYIRKDYQDQFEPLVISWGYKSQDASASQFIDYHQWQGTRDMSAFLSVPAAIKFQERHNWENQRSRLLQLTRSAHDRLLSLLGFLPLSKNSRHSEDWNYSWFAQMVAVQIPNCDPQKLQELLYERYSIEIPVFLWEGIPVMRLSIQAYNTTSDIDRLINALQAIIKNGFFK